MLAGLLIWADPASSATVRGLDRDSEVVIVDSRGERNRLEVSADFRVVVRERGDAPLVAAGLCRQAGEREVRCPVDSLEVFVYAGGGNDRVTAVASRLASINVAGGAGNDRLEAGRSSGTLAGGPGNDVLVGGVRGNRLWGGGGDDRLSGGRGHDLLAGDGRGSLYLFAPSGTPGVGDDVLDGGPGRDTASWQGRDVPVAVDLARQRARSASDRDRLRAIENVAGGRRADRLIGDGGPNRLQGGGAADTLRGRGGNDRLDVSARFPDFDPGNDGAADHLDCGPGDDTVVDAGRGLGGPRRPEPIPRDCELLTMAASADLDGGPLRVQPLRFSGRRLRIRVACSFEYSACHRRVTVLAGGVRLGRSRTVRVRHGVSTITVPLSRPLPSRGVIVVRTSGPRYDFRYRLRL
jgi:Ca2+-binding RTX toxin-like protein